MNRKLVLTVILVALSAVALYMYSGVVMEYTGPVINPVLEMVGMAPAETDTSDVSMSEEPSKNSPGRPTPEQLYKQVNEHFLATLSRSLDLPEFRRSDWESIDGISFESQVQAHLPENMPQGPPWESLNLSLNLESHKSGQVDGELNIREPADLPLNRLIFQRGAEAFQLVFPGESEYFRSTIDTALEKVGAVGMIEGLQATTWYPPLRSTSLDTQVWQNEEAYVLEVGESSLPSTSLYVTTDRPFAVIGWEKDQAATGDNGSVSYQVRYQGEDRRRFRSFDSSNSDAGKTEFVYQNDQIERVRYQPGTPDGYEWAEFQFEHGDRYSRSAQVVFQPADGPDTRSWLSLQWGFQDRLPSRFGLEVEYELEDTAEELLLSLDVDPIEWLRDPAPIQLTSNSEWQQIDQQQLNEKFMPLTMMAVSMMQQEEAAEETIEAPDETEQQASADEPESARERADEPAEPKEAEPSQREPTTERAETSPEPTEQPDEPTEPAQESPREVGEAAAGSGETIRYSSIGRFPMSEAPPEYEQARQAYHAGDFTRAENTLKPLLEKYPNSANTNYLLGMIHFEQGDFEEAKPYFVKASELDHDPQIKEWSEVWINRINHRLESEGS